MIKKRIEKGIRNLDVLPPDLFNLYSKMFLNELEILPGFIDVRYANETVWMADSERKMKELIDNVLDEQKSNH